MKTTWMLIFATVLGLWGCSKHSSPTLAADLESKNTAASASVEAGKFLRDLHEQGKLPGLSKTDHGELKANVSDFSKPVHFPLSLSFSLAKNGDSIYNYTVEKSSMGSGWRLIKARQTDPGGNTVKEFPIQ
jgi:hypothetical protein